MGEGNWERRQGAGTGSTAQLYQVTNPGLPTLKTGKCPRVPEEPGGNPTRDGTGGCSTVPTNACSFPFRAGMMSGVALREELSYLMPVSACSEPVDQKRWWGSPGNMGRARRSAPLRRISAHKWCFGNHFTRQRQACHQQPRLGARGERLQRCHQQPQVLGEGHGAPDGPTDGHTALLTDPSQHQGAGEN